MIHEKMFSGSFYLPDKHFFFKNDGVMEISYGPKSVIMIWDIMIAEG